MTREEAIMVLKNEQPHCGKKALFPEEKKYEAFNIAIKALEQEPREDAVSRGVFEQVMWERDVAIDQLKKLGYGFGEKPKTGHWIVLSPTDMYCSECNEIEHLDTSRKFCAYCGTKMLENPTGLESEEQA